MEYDSGDEKTSEGETSETDDFIDNMLLRKDHPQMAQMIREAEKELEQKERMQETSNDEEECGMHWLAYTNCKLVHSCVSDSEPEIPDQPRPDDAGSEYEHTYSGNRWQYKSWEKRKSVQAPRRICNLET